MSPKKPKRATLVKRIRIAPDDDIREDLAIWGEARPDWFDLVSEMLELAARCSFAECGFAESRSGVEDLFLRRLFDFDDRFFEEVAQAIRYWREWKQKGGYVDPLRAFLVYIKNQRPFSYRQFRELAPSFVGVSERTIYRAAKDVGYRFAAVKDTPPLDRHDRTMCELFFRFRNWTSGRPVKPRTDT